MSTFHQLEQHWEQCQLRRQTLQWQKKIRALRALFSPACSAAQNGERNPAANGAGSPKAKPGLRQHRTNARGKVGAQTF
jgi:hypothetical protein